MAENIINIATLTIDTQKASDQIVETKKNIFELQKANTELRKAIVSGEGDVTEQTRQFVEQEQKIKQLQASYRQQSTALNEYTLENVKNSKSLTENASSINQATQQNKELIATRNQVNVSTDEGRKAIELINLKLEENRKFINANSSDLEKQKDNIGNYGSALDRADGLLSKFGINSGGVRNVVQGFTSTISNANKQIDDIANSFINGTRATLGFKTQTQLASESQLLNAGAGKAQVASNTALTGSQKAVTVATNASVIGFNLLKLAIIATGIGAVVILFTALTTSLSKSEESSNKFSKSLSVFKGITSAVFKVLKPLGDFLADTLSVAFENVGVLADKALTLVAKGLSVIGFNDASKAVNNFNNSIKEGTKNAQALADAEAELQKANRLTAKTQKEFELQAERLRQIRDDQAKSTDERIKANTQLGAVLQKQSGQEIALAQKGLQFAQLKAKLEGKNSENLDLIAESEAKIADIRERISSQESEQLSNLNSLRKEVADKERERKLKLLDNDLLIFNSQQKSAEEQIVFFQNYYERLNKIENNENRLKNAQDLSSKLLEIATTQIDGEIELQQKLISDKKRISETEKTDLLANAEFLKQAEKTRIENSLLSESDKNKALLEVESGFLESVELIKKTFEDSEKLRKEEQIVLDKLAFENRLLLLEEQGFAEAELKKQILTAELEEKNRLLQLDLENEKVTAEQARLIKENEDKKYKKATKIIDDEVNKTKRAANIKNVQDSIASLQAIFGESKALAVASALVNTYQGITAALKEPTIAQRVIGVTLATATGFAAVKNILKTDKGSTSVGSNSVPSVNTSTPQAVFENPATTQTVARLQTPPPNDPNNTTQTVLVLETLDEVKNQQQIKIKSN